MHLRFKQIQVDGPLQRRTKNALTVLPLSEQIRECMQIVKKLRASNEILGTVNALLMAVPYILEIDRLRLRPPLMMVLRGILIGKHRLAHLVHLGLTDRLIGLAVDGILVLCPKETALRHPQGNTKNQTDGVLGVVRMNPR